MILKPRTKKLKSKRRLMRAFLEDKNQAIYDETGFILMDPSAIRNFMNEGYTADLYNEFFDTLTFSNLITDGKLCPFCLSVKISTSKDCPDCWQVTSCNDSYICSHPNSRWATIVNVFMYMSEYYLSNYIGKLMAWNNHPDPLEVR